jgi:hypothetical protein
VLRSLPIWACALVAAAGLSAAFVRARSSPSARAIAQRERALFAPDASSRAPAFRDVTAELGIDFLHDADARGEFRLPEEMGPGVALFDCDGDNDLDLFVAGGGTIDGNGTIQTSRLWLNEGARFRDVTQERGAAVAGPSYGSFAADYDSDGDQDLFITRLGPDVLLRNDGARFVECAAEAGLADPGFSTGAVFFDYDRDGRLDLYVCNYVDWSPSIERACYMGGLREYCDPSAYDAAAQDRLYHNVGNGRFEDATARAGMLGKRGQGLGVVAHDFDGDGDLDLYVANDSTPAMLWRNQGDGTFVEDSLRAGCAYNALGVAIAGMGIACEDLDGDMAADLLITNIRGQSHLALLSRGTRFEDASARMGLPAWSTRWTGFGVAAFDQDLDGALELYVANGAVNLDPVRIGDPRPYVEPDQFLRLVGGRTLDISAGSGALLDESSRGLATGDLDGDGDLDLVVSAFDGRLHVLRNEHSGSDHWLTVDARDVHGSPALGARVELRAGSLKLVRWIRAHASYLASQDPRAHFGLAAASLVDELTVTWPDGTQTRIEKLDVNRTLSLRQGESR